VLWTRRGPAVPRALVLAAGWLIGVSALGNLTRPHFPPDPFMVEQVQALREMAPGSFIMLSPWQAWAFTSALLVGMLAIADLAQRTLWWNAFYWTLLLTGVSIAAFGLVQVIAGAPALLWDTGTPTTGHFFATFFHYPPAGAFLNLTWPLSAVIILAAVLGKWRRARQRLPIGIAGAVMTALFFAALFNQRSRIAQALGVLVGFVFTVAAAFSEHEPASKKRGSPFVRVLRGFAWLMAAAAIGWVTLQSPLFKVTRERWHQLASLRATPVPEPAPPVVWDSTGRGDRLIESNHPTRGQLLWDRRLAWGTALRMIESRPWLGFGLRGWTEAYPHFTGDPFLKTFFLYVQFTHQDALQTLVEWGFLGAAGWGIVIAGGVWRGLRAFRRGPAKWSLRDWQRLAILLGLMAVFVHGFIEFPLQIPSVQWFAATLLALLWARPNRSSRSPRRRHHRPHARDHKSREQEMGGSGDSSRGRDSPQPLT
ncbi:MAG: O-antigen ligase family protein, partial [Verrucomicrobiota bacterium]|nr:O-antigen ligase family protein [Verrucomicrobiota bacterium]